MFKVPNQYRLHDGPMGSPDEIGNNGFFIVPFELNRKCGEGVTIKLSVIASDGEGWEHVSVSTEFHTPLWEMMCLIKSLFWDADDCVMQLHPPESDYVNVHEFCLHLWRPIGQDIPRPPSYLVGPSTLNKKK